MHSVAEIIIPPGFDIEEGVRQIMESKTFCGEEEEQRGRGQRCDWWDFYVIGGRWSGRKLQASLDPVKWKWFLEELVRRKVTVSGFVCGKESLEPGSQIPVVDQLWRKTFPGAGKTCPLFSHGRDQYGREGVFADDVCPVRGVPKGLSCGRLILAKPHWKEEGKIEPAEMLVAEFWNGCTHQKTDFDGVVATGIEKMAARVKEYYRPEYARHWDNLPDWQVVTVDYHN